ncbi:MULTISPECIES: nucleotidyltransferase domain-containing protein [Chryseobacterium]|uniref:nucleotidyltransferase domain-containing protein n=1 Tax=Chryseobacterium TaxID=59732 RepID=UPI00162376E9|nr:MULTISPECIES: nucleotidyltransferase domain-containing protein [Chryseobacterium]MDM1553697.1 nucleotidyltransferase domain-containing protein [Chryseobacterium indologenes]
MDLKSLEEKIISNFKTENINGILLAGSYATNTQTENSDIDLRLIFNNDRKHTVKGIKYIEGLKVSYFGENIGMVKKRMSVDFSRNSRFEARLFTLGKILYDQDGNVEELVQYAKIFMENSFQKKLTQDDITLRMYSLHVRHESLLNTPLSNPIYTYNYISFMKAVLVTYSVILNYEMVIDIKPEKILTNSSYREINQWKDFPDQDFVELWIKGVYEITPNNLEAVYQYVQSQTLVIERKDFEVIYRD